MQQQTYPIDHFIYMNGDPSALALMGDLTGHGTHISSGPNMDQHRNHRAALDMSNYRYDLYFKIDDDDIYRPNYVQRVIDAYDETWDYSAGYSNGILLGAGYRQGTLKSLCVDPTPEEVQKGVQMFMPSTLVLNQRALAEIGNLSEEDLYHTYEDIVWRNRLWDSSARFFLRTDPKFTQDFTYVVHGANISTAGWLRG